MNTEEYDPRVFKNIKPIDNIQHTHERSSLKLQLAFSGCIRSLVHQKAPVTKWREVKHQETYLQHINELHYVKVVLLG